MAEAADIFAPAVAGSSMRGTVLHKLMEEVLLGETADSFADLKQRADKLLAQLGIVSSLDATTGVSATELASTIMRTLELPSVEALRPRLIPEIPIFGWRNGVDGEMLMSGVADAVVIDEKGAVEAVIDWKSDVDVAPRLMDHYWQQLNDYRRYTGAKYALLVMMTSGKAFEIN